MSEEQTRVLDEPMRSRPILPEGYIPEGTEESLIEWSDVDERLAAAPVYWLSTASADGDPHVTPIWGAWVDGALYFDGYYEKTRWGRNLMANPRIVVSIESGSYAIMLKGVAELVNVPPDTFSRVSDSFAARYKGYRPPTSEGMFAVRPRLAFAWDNDKYSATATRWRFEGC
jgi:hypothetical protein